MIIQDDIIKAEEGKILLYKPENKLWGKAARLANYNGKMLAEDDFSELPEDEFENIEGVWFDFRNKTYTYIKTTIIGLHYSNNDQIAILCNYSLDPDKYKEKYDKMQEWRLYASKIASKYFSNLT